MTTVPNPFMLNTRSMGKRGNAVESRAGVSAAAFNKAGEFFYNDCVWPHITGKVVVQ